MAEAAWPSFISQLGLQGRRAILDLPDRRDLLEFRDLPDHKELLDCRGLPDRKDRLDLSALLERRAQQALLVRQGLLDRLDQLALPDLRALWDSPAHKDFKDLKVNKALKDLPDQQERMRRLGPTPTPPRQA